MFAIVPLLRHSLFSIKQFAPLPSLSLSLSITKKTNKSSAVLLYNRFLLLYELTDPIIFNVCSAVAIFLQILFLIYSTPHPSSSPPSHNGVLFLYFDNIDDDFWCALKKTKMPTTTTNNKNSHKLCEFFACSVLFLFFYSYSCLIFVSVCVCFCVYTSKST